MEDATLVPPAPPPSEIALLAELAFATRHTGADKAHAPRNLIFLPSDALDVDLSDPMQRDFGDYELKEKIGRGGMGVVYRAHQRSLNREVALKLLIAGPWAPAEFIERFRSEAQSAARLEHPNIVTVYESGNQQDLQYFSMRLVRGESLSKRLQRERSLPPREAARMLRIVAEAVDYAHRLGVLHLDLKPGNVLLDETGEPLVADFGLARRVDEVLADPNESLSGTPSYMAPEQADGRAQSIGRATDIYGLGSVLYELLSGEPPFSAGTTQATLERVLREDVKPPREHDARIPRDLEAICLKCLCKDPAQRYLAAGALAEDLRSFLEDRPVSVRQSPPIERMRRWARREPRFAAAVAGVAFALVVGLAATAQQWRRAEGNAFAARELIWEGRREAALQLEQDGEGLEALSRLLANVREQEEADEVQQAELERLRIGMLRGQGAELIDSVVVADANPLAVGLSADGSMLAIAFNDLTVRWYDSARLIERGRVSLAERPTSDGQVRGPVLVRFVEESRLLVTLEWYGQYVSPTEADSWLVDLTAGAVVEPPADFADFSDAAYSADARFALLRDRSGRVQLRETVSWAPRSPLIADDTTLVWRLDHDGRRAFGLGNAMRVLTIRDLHGGAEPRQLTLPGNDGVSAWMLSADGRHLALGDFEGRVFLLETDTLELRQLPALPGREVTWISFSEDDEWLAVGNFDGLAQVLDVASGDLLASGEMRAEFALQRVGLSREQRLLIAAGAGEIALWRIPLRGPRTRPAQRIGFGPAGHGLAGRYPIAWSLPTGLLASAGMDGQVRLWRLPASPSAVAQRARQVSDLLHPDGERLVDIEWNKLRLASPLGRGLTDWLPLAQPPGYAELLDEGRLLVVTVGPELHVYDAAITLRPRFAPVALPASPQRLLASSDGRYVLLAFGAHTANGHEEQLRLFDARAGAWLPGEATVLGPSPRFKFSPDYQWLVVVGPEEGVTTLLRTDGLQVVAEFPHDPFEPVVAADFQDQRLVLLTRPGDPRYGRESVLWWDPVTDRIDARHDTTGAGVQGVVASADAVFVAGTEHDLRIDADGRTLRLPRIARGEPTSVMALSPDGRLLARAYRHVVQLHEAASGALVGLPLAADVDTLDWLAQVGFTPDGFGLRARSLLRRDLYWSFDHETAAIAAVAADLERLRLSESGGHAVYAHSAAERRRLRAADPGAWPDRQPRPETAVAQNAAPGVVLPARTAGAAAALLDLGPVYHRDPFWYANTFWVYTPMQRLPIGVQRIGGVDFDIRGFIDIAAVSLAANGEVSAVASSIECLGLPEAPLSALHLLAQSRLPVPAETGETLAQLTLHYGDGSRAILPLRAGQELPGYAGDDGAVPIVFATDHFLMVAAGIFNVWSAPRIPNPHPDRVPRCLDLEIARADASLAVFAITAEPLEHKSL